MAELGPEGRWRVGRAADNELVIDSPLVSGRHLLIERAEGRLWLTDLGSTNGSFVNGRRLNPQAREAVSEDATVTLGSLTLTAGVIEQARRGRLMRPRDTDRLLIGRALFTDLRLDAPTVSDQHAELRREGGEWFLRDLNSAAGTWVNGRLARGWIRLHQGDRVELGRFRLALDSLGAGSPTFTALDYGRELRLELRGVGVSAPNGAVLLNDVQLAARPGELVMVLGPSGAGKSTLLRLLAGLSRPTTGRVTINGQDLQGRGGFFAPLIGWVPQQETLPEGLTAAEVLRFAARLRLPPEAVEERVTAVLDSLELGPVAGVRVNSGLSGGQLRRLSIGVELLSDPGLLVLDEPCAGLDSRASLNVLRLCRRLADSGRPVVLSAHAPRPEALELADLAVVLAEGCLVWAGPPGGAMRAFFTPAGRRPHPQATAADLAMDSLAPQDGAEQAEVWAARFATTETYARYVAARLGPGEPSPSPSPAEPPRPTPARAFVQYVTLCRRSALQLTRSPADLALLAAQAPLVGALIVALFRPPGFLWIEGYGVVLAARDQLSPALFLLAAAAMWLGNNNAARELVRERASFRRERRAGLSAGAAICAKATVLGLASAVQALVLTLAAAALGPPIPTDPPQLAAIWAVLTLTGWSGVSLGLLISAAARSPFAAALMVPLAVLPQIMLGGLVASLPSLEPLARAAADTIVPLRSSFDALDRLALTELPGGVERLRSLGLIPDSGAPGPWSERVSLLALQAVAPLLPAWLLLRRA
ncbi:FHA domain-containing protein [Myxococcota bacterium]|nr:FHA domain-containing protein [Myxococcota bacterium]